ncbi:glycosyltransferase [candidate division KSB1 bacterium]|nr:glycosyltransferase [candidate division KSB1 bacterium]
MKKVKSTCLAWRTLGVEVDIFLLTKNRTLAKDLSSQNDYSVNIHIFLFRSFIGKIFRFRSLVNHVLKLNATAIYFRYQPFLPGFFKLSRKSKVFIEINGDDLIEIRQRSKLKYVIVKLTRNLMFSNAAGLIFVTHALSNHPHFRQSTAPRLVLANGISLSDYADMQPSAKGLNAKPMLVFIGSEGQNWHGVDKILVMAEIFKDWQFTVIGLEKSYFHSPPANINFTGFLQKESYSSIMQRADIGIGSLALYRKQMYEACPLKVREYLAYGLPVIIGYRDTDFMDGASFILELENRKENIKNNVDLITQFVGQWKGKKVPRNRINKLDILEKEKQRLAFLAQHLA